MISWRKAEIEPAKAYIMITWKHKDTDFAGPWTLDQKIEIFRERCLGWQLHIADLMANGGTHLNGRNVIPPIPDSGFAVLHVCMSYFESIARYEEGDTTSDDPGVFFKKGVKSVFPAFLAGHASGAEALLKSIYKGARCGLYHCSMTKLGIALSDKPPEAVSYDAGRNEVTFNPHKLPLVLKAHLANYVKKVCDPAETDLRKNFEKRFDVENGLVIIGSPSAPVGADTEKSGAKAPSVGASPAGTPTLGSGPAVCSGPVPPAIAPGLLDTPTSSGTGTVAASGVAPPSSHPPGS